jgi:hypothetical protein
VGGKNFVMPDWLASSPKQTGESTIPKKFAFKAQFPSIAKPLLKMQGNPTIQPNQIAWKLEITVLEIALRLEVIMLVNS